MASETRPVLLLCRSPNEGPGLRGELESLGYAVLEPSANAIGERLSEAHALVVDGRDADADLLQLLRRIGLRSIDERPPILFRAAQDTLSARLDGYAQGADAVIAANAGVEELQAQMRVLDRWQATRKQWLYRAAEAQRFNQQLQHAYQQIDLDLKMARRLQASFLPRALPTLGAVRFAVSYHPCGQVGGDFYDVLRLDEHHVGFYIADAMGHGVPASLLTIFLKRAVQFKEVGGGSYRLIPPSEVLGRLNRELIAQDLPDLPFITMFCGLIDCRDGRLRMARAAHPHPVHVPAEGAPEAWESFGTLLGVFDSEYPEFERQLRPGDRLILYTDGLPTLDEAGTKPERLYDILDHARAEPLNALVEHVARMPRDDSIIRDDVTVLAIEMQDI